MRERITAGNRTLSYLEAEGHVTPARKARVAVLIHGFPLNAEMWQPQLAVVPDGWRFIAPDLPGFGESDPVARPGPAQASPGIDDYAGAVIDLMDALHIDSAMIGGLSMGGYVTFAVHRRAPTYFAGMLLANTRAQADSDEGRAGRLKMIDLVSAEGAPGVARQMLPKLLGEDTRNERSEIVRQVEELILAAPPDAIVAALHAMMSRPDSTSDLGHVTCPTLVVSGDQDTLIPPDESRFMQRKILSAQVEVLSGAGHLSNMEQPQAFSRALARFLTDRV